MGIVTFFITLVTKSHEPLSRVWVDVFGKSQRKDSGTSGFCGSLGCRIPIRVEGFRLLWCELKFGGGFRIQACLPCPCRSFNTSVCSI